MKLSTASLNSRLDLPDYLRNSKITGEGVEVGVLFGEFSEHLLNNWQGRLHMIDPWIQQPPSQYLDGSNSVDMEAAFRESTARVAPFGKRANVVRAFSHVAAKLYPNESMVFVYIDANHAYPWVLGDLEAWYPKVQSGGLLCGHDFKNENTRYWSCGVRQAVEEFALKYGLEVVTTPTCTSWWIVKP